MTVARVVGWTLARWALAGVFVYAGSLKLVDPAAFAASIARFQIVPHFFVHPIALGLPPFEILCGIALLIKPWRRPAALGVALLSAIFLSAILAAELRDIEVECSCFGGTSSEPVWSLITRDLVFFAGASLLYLRDLRRSSRSQGKNAPAVGVLNGAH